MIIKRKAQFVIGIIDILVGIACLFACVYWHRGSNIIYPFITIICGVVSLMQGIETKAARERRKEKLQVMAKMYGWDKEVNQND